MPIKPLKTLLRALFGPADSWHIKRLSRRASNDLACRLQEALAWTSPETRECDEQPVFLLSAGWRSGSTLLQRMLMEHNPNIILWGEPFDHSNIYDGMANQFRPFTAQWPLKRFFLSKRADSNLSDKWVANLYPDVDHLLKAHRRFFDTVFGEPARTTGHRSWGIKEVRLTIDHARYFRALYPKCKIIFLYRNPQDAYRSFRRLEARWFRRWPDDLVKTAYAFGRHWAQTTHGFIAECRSVDGFLIRYEDLDSQEDIERLSKYIGWTVSRSSQLARRDIAESKGTSERLPWPDQAILQLVTGKTRKAAGY